MAEYCVATIPVLMPHRRLRPRAADPSRPWNTTQPSPTSATRIGKRLAGKLHEPFERAGGGRAINPTSPDSTARRSGLERVLPHRGMFPRRQASARQAGGIAGRAPPPRNITGSATFRVHGKLAMENWPWKTGHGK